MEMVSGKVKSHLELEYKLYHGVCPILRQERRVLVISPSAKRLRVRWLHSPKDKPLQNVSGLSHYQWRLHQLLDGQMESKEQTESQGILTGHRQCLLYLDRPQP